MYYLNIFIVMENFIVQINGSYIDLPYVANAADGKSQPRRSYLTSGTEVASGCGYSYCYKTLKLVLKGKEHFLPENLYREGVSYRFLDYHTEWPFLLRERGGKIVKKQIPLLALYGIAPEEVLDRSAFCKLTLPEFQHKGKLTTVFYVGAYRFGVAFESDLMQLYHRKAEFAEDKAALFMADEYRFWIDGGSNPTAYFADGLRCEKTAPFIDVTDCQDPLPVGKETLERFWDELDLYRIPEKAQELGIGKILGKAADAVPLRDYSVEAELLPPFATKNGYRFGSRSHTFQEDCVLSALPGHIRSIMKEEAPQKFGHLFQTGS